MAIQVSPEMLKGAAMLALISKGGPAKGASVGASGVLSDFLGGSSGGDTTDNVSPELRRFMDEQYPKSFTPGTYHDYKVEYYKGKKQRNEVGKGFEKELSLGGRMQSKDEHNNALLKFMRPGMTPKEQHVAAMMGQEYEKSLPQFWNESEGRPVNGNKEYAVSSSAVDGIRLTPDGRIEVRWGTGPTWYTFKEYPNTHEASLAAQKLLMADSIGQAVMPTLRNGKPVKFKKKLTDDGHPMGYWNKANYDGAMV